MSAELIKINEEIQRINLVIIRILLKKSIVEIRNDKGLNSHTLPEKVIYNGMDMNRSNYCCVCKGTESFSYRVIDRKIVADTVKDTNTIKGFFFGTDKGLIDEVGFSVEWWKKKFEEQVAKKHKFDEEFIHEKEMKEKFNDIVDAFINKQNKYERCNLILDWIWKIADNNNRKNVFNMNKIITEIEGIEVSKLKNLDEEVLEKFIMSAQTKVDAASTILQFKRLQ